MPIKPEFVYETENLILNNYIWWHLITTQIIALTLLSIETIYRNKGLQNKCKQCIFRCIYIFGLTNSASSITNIL